MTTPAFTRREAMTIDHLLTGWGGLDGLEAPLRPQPLEPQAEVAKFLALMVQTAQGRQVVDWLMDITFRAPFRATGKTFEETALLAATRQGIEGVGEAILAAINHGAALIERDQAGKDA